eukprot:COSAG01_NODE_251_length_20305_cov_5.846447_25_plen_99_part_00
MSHSLPHVLPRAQGLRADDVAESADEAEPPLRIDYHPAQMLGAGLAFGGDDGGVDKASAAFVPTALVLHADTALSTARGSECAACVGGRSHAPGLGCR